MKSSQASLGGLGLAVLAALTLKYRKAAGPPLLPYGGFHLTSSPPAQFYDHLLTPNEVAALNDRVDALGAELWAPCAEKLTAQMAAASEHRDLLQCAELPVGQVEQTVLGRLYDIFHVPLEAREPAATHLSVRRMPPGSPCVEPHSDEWETSQLPLHRKRYPDVVSIIYLRGAPRGTGRFTFASTNLKVPPLPGAMLGFAIEEVELPDGSVVPSNFSRHWVEEVPADAPTDRVFIQVSLDLSAPPAIALKAAGAASKPVLPSMDPSKLVLPSAMMLKSDESSSERSGHIDDTACSACDCGSVGSGIRRLLFASTSTCDKCCALLRE